MQLHGKIPRARGITKYDFRRWPGSASCKSARGRLDGRKIISVGGFVIHHGGARRRRGFLNIGVYAQFPSDFCHYGLSPLPIAIDRVLQVNFFSRRWAKVGERRGQLSLREHSVT